MNCGITWGAHVGLKCEKDILKRIAEDDWMMNILTSAKSLKLPDWWICAGFVRSKIWDTLHGYRKRTPISDIDVIYFDKENIDEAEEKRLECRLRTIHPNEPWSVKNEARMHIANAIPPYLSSVDAISKFPETATALGVKLDMNNDLILIAPHGIDDVIHLEVKPTNYFEANENRMAIYKHRISMKNWESNWGMVKVQY